MNKVVLLPHNEVGYNELINYLQEHQEATVNRATGTGKTFIGLKYAYENRKKRILILAPTYPILDQWQESHMQELGISKSEFKKLDTMIYSNLLKIDDIEAFADQYDIIIFDEYHRCGAQRWGKKAKQLKDALLKDPDKRAIGFTATEIRYLDRNRNMKDILFKGNEASRLTLEDAILNGILPAPCYINCDFEIIEEISNTITRVKKLLPFYYSEKKKLIAQLENIKAEFIRVLYNSIDIEKNIKDNEKYLMFSTTIKSITEDKKIIKVFFKDYDLKEYNIHSGKSKESNKKALADFRKPLKSGVSLLSSVSILNEGVHVKDVYGIFMCRNTFSPIIYFQQIGRLLSFSKRNDKVVVFDLAGNIGNHKVIYELYNNVVKKAKELLITDPINRERYLTIIENFKIVDKVSLMYSQLDEIKQQFSNKSLIYNMLLKNIEYLETSDNIDLIKKYCIEDDIKKYYKYIDLDLFKRIQKIDNLEKPKLFELTEEEFIKALKGYNNLYELINRKYVISFEKVEEYAKNNYCLPSIFTDDEDEKYLAFELHDNYKRYKKTNKDVIRGYIDDTLSVYERINYGDIPEDVDLEELIEEINIIIGYNKLISKNIISYLKILVLQKQYPNINELSLIIRKLEKYNRDILIKKTFEDSEEEDYSKYIEPEKRELVNFKNQLLEQIYERVNEVGLENTISEQYLRIKSFIEKNKCIPKKEIIAFLSKEDNELSKELYCIMQIFEEAFDNYGYSDKIDRLIYNSEIETEELILQNINEFMETHNGILPSRFSSDYYERRLAKYVKKIKQQRTNPIKKKFESFDELKKKIIDLYNGVEFINSPELYSDADIYRLKTFITIKEAHMIDAARCLRKVINFMINHKYELPCLLNNDDEEILLARNFDYIKNYLNINHLNILKEYLSKQEQYKEIFVDEYCKFIDENGRVPRIQTDKTSSEYELACSYNRWKPYIDKKSINRIIVKRIIKFMDNHNGEMPNINSSNGLEHSLAFSYRGIKNKLDGENKLLLEQRMKDREKEKATFINNLLDFIRITQSFPNKNNNKELYESYNRWVPYLSYDEKRRISTEINRSKIIEFILSHNYELPSVKNSESEKEIAHICQKEKKLFEAILVEYKDELEKSKIDFVEKYSEFINMNDRMPLMTNPDEKKLIISYNRWVPYLNENEMEKITIKKISKYKAMKNAYKMLNESKRK